MYAKLIIIFTPRVFKNFPVHWVIHESNNIQANERLVNLKLQKNDQLLNLMFFFFNFLCSNAPHNKCQTEVVCVVFYMGQTMVLVLVCACMIAHIKWRWLVLKCLFYWRCMFLKNFWNVSSISLSIHFFIIQKQYSRLFITCLGSN